MESSVNILNTPLAPNPVLSILSVGSRFHRRRGGFFGNNMDKTCSWAYSCNDPIMFTKYDGRTFCGKHWRFCNMRRQARRSGKTVPPYGILHQLLKGLMPKLLCPVCKRTMGWKRNEVGGRVLTLQHDRSGEFRLICLTCNIRHTGYRGDDFYTIGKTHKHCGGCNKMLPRSSFGPAGERIQTLCYPCETTHKRQWREKRRRAGLSYT